MAVIFILDTSAYSAFNHGDIKLRAWFTTSNNIIIPLIVVGELRAGFAVGNRTAENEQLLQRFLDAPNVKTATISNKTTQLFADIYHSLRKAGTPIGTNDMWIAAIALECDKPLLTLNTDFSRIPGLEIAKI